MDVVGARTRRRSRRAGATHSTGSAEGGGRMRKEEGDLFDDDVELDEEFPLGDGTADTEATVICPYCAECVSIALDPGSGDSQAYVQDCEVCCQPWRVVVTYLSDGSAD